MKILVIDGCYRKGNTWKITQKAMEVIKKSFSDVTYEEVVLIREDLPTLDFPANAISGLSLSGSTLVIPQTVSKLTFLITIPIFPSCRLIPLL